MPRLFLVAVIVIVCSVTMTTALHVDATKSCTGCTCSCSWANKNSCGNNDGSCCFGCCCSAYIATPAPPAPTPAPATTKTCTARGGCTCGCSWANKNSCGTDDGSCCFGCCCSAYITTPAPVPATPTPSSSLPTYCPSASDLVVAYGAATLTNRGWTIRAGGAAATKASFNLLGGSVEYDVSFSGVPVGVNANVYTISPSNLPSSGFTQSKYCDGQGTGSNWCLEFDWIESNGNCGGATTLHSVAGPGANGCTAWGCSASYFYNSQPSFHMKISYGNDGSFTVTRNGDVISPSSLSPAAGTSDFSTIKNIMQTIGSVVYSSQWVGWVPVASCGNGGSLANAVFTVTNLKISGKVVQGPLPTKC